MLCTTKHAMSHQPATVLPRRVLGDPRPVQELLVGLPLADTLRWRDQGSGLEWSRSA